MSAMTTTRLEEIEYRYGDRPYVEELVAEVRRLRKENAELAKNQKATETGDPMSKGG